MAAAQLHRSCCGMHAVLTGLVPISALQCSRLPAVLKAGWHDPLGQPRLQREQTHNILALPWMQCILLQLPSCLPAYHWYDRCETLLAALVMGRSVQGIPADKDEAAIHQSFSGVWPTLLPKCFCQIWAWLASRMHPRPMSDRGSHIQLCTDCIPLIAASRTCQAG